jgi:transcriptional regulator with XRE-family HTH domain
VIFRFHVENAVDYPVRTLQQLRPVLQGFRKSKGLTQAQLAARLGISQQSYAKLEADPAKASFERLFTILQLLRVEVALRPMDQQDPAAAKLEW